MKIIWHESSIFKNNESLSLLSTLSLLCYLLSLCFPSFLHRLLLVSLFHDLRSVDVMFLCSLESLSLSQVDVDAKLSIREPLTFTWTFFLVLSLALCFFYQVETTHFSLCSPLFKTFHFFQPCRRISNTRYPKRWRIVRAKMISPTFMFFGRWIFARELDYSHERTFFPVLFSCFLILQARQQ